MTPPRLHLDADTSIKALHTALLARGHDVTRTPNAWMARDAVDTEQLLGAETTAPPSGMLVCKRTAAMALALSPGLVENCRHRGANTHWAQVLAGMHAAWAAASRRWQGVSAAGTTRAPQ